MITYKIYIIRHGITAANQNGRFAGVTDYPLCAEGIDGLKQLASDFIYPNVGKIYGSPLTRCRQTAAVL